ncbi:sulfonate ABC transporter substrate-binding protein [Scleromatobacter humisilvae]|uniref:Putative aliphatic sulfonates-binding protein n=1 Tax=Scleromatobacter humisilvae TaxID=2897159 RepID=A0A9X1YHE1_9BURK|nr:sulfonate ABC transporter substrate-binding protein [Scleromatobacter humisilvae]MCK9684823.1 sulfonate ABC transporter substrate-binding protein [Scleromatobacter humisilvae]
MTVFSSSRRRWLAAASALALTLGTAAVHADPARELRIGFQKSASLLVLQKAQGTLEKRLAPQGVAVKWVEFPAGPQLLEGLNVGAVDVGYVGEAPPIFAQAAGARFVYVGNDPAAPSTEALVVQKDSALKSVAELKGRRVALNKGSNVHYLLVKLLEKNGLKYSDITPVFLPPSDARAAFEKGAVDAWVIWDPFLAAAEHQLGARQLADGTGLVNSFSFYLAQTDYARANPAVIHALFANTDDAARFVQADVPRAAALIAPLQGLDAAVVETSLRRYRYGVTPLTPAVAAQQQQIADTFLDLKLIPKPVRIADALPVNAAATLAGK